MSYKQLTLEQQHPLSGLLKNGMSQTAVAQSLKVHPSTLSHELRRNRVGDWASLWVKLIRILSSLLWSAPHSLPYSLKGDTNAQDVATQAIRLLNPY